MNWKFIMFNNCFFKIKNMYKFGLWCLKLIKFSLIVICFCVLLLEYGYKWIIFKGKKFWWLIMLKVDLGNSISCFFWYGLKIVLGVV